MLRLGEDINFGAAIKEIIWLNVENIGLNTVGRSDLFFFDRMIGYGYRTPDILHTLQSFFQGYSEHSAAGPYQLGSTILGCDC